MTAETILATSALVAVPIPEYDDFFTNFDKDLFPIPDLMDTLDSTGITSVDISSIDTLIAEVIGATDLPILKVSEDGGFEAGCGGKLWVAGKLLSLYLIKNYKQISSMGRDIKKVVELGSGTGVVGLALGLLLKYQTGIDHHHHHHHDQTMIHLTDLPQVIPVLSKNVEANHLKETCSADELDWFNATAPDYLINDGKKVDLILVADCVYDVKLFDILIKTLLMLCNVNHEQGDEETIILFSFRKRRKSNARFFKTLRKSFKVEEILDYEGYEEFQKQRCHLFKLVIKR